MNTVLTIGLRADKSAGISFFSSQLTTQTAVTHTQELDTSHRHTTRSMPTTRGSSSGGASAADHAGSEQQADPCMDVDPTNEPIDVDEDRNQT